MTKLLGLSITISNVLCDWAGTLEDHGHSLASERVTRFRSTFSKWSCRLLLGHPRVIYGPMGDICLDCLSIVDEHPSGRGRPA